MMSKKSMIFLFAVSLALNFLKIVKGNDHIWPCFNLAICGGGMDSKYQEKYDTVIGMPEKKDFKFISEELIKAGFAFSSTDDFAEFKQNICELDEEKRESAFNEVMPVSFEKFTEYCANPITATDCNRWNNFQSDAAELYDEMHEDGIC